MPAQQVVRPGDDQFKPFKAHRSSLSGTPLQVIIPRMVSWSAAPFARGIIAVVALTVIYVVARSRSVLPVAA